MGRMPSTTSPGPSVDAMHLPFACGLFRMRQADHDLQGSSTGDTESHTEGSGGLNEHGSPISRRAARHRKKEHRKARAKRFGPGSAHSLLFWAGGHFCAKPCCQAIIQEMPMRCALTFQILTAKSDKHFCGGSADTRRQLTPSLVLNHMVNLVILCECCSWSLFESCIPALQITSSCMMTSATVPCGNAGC